MPSTAPRRRTTSNSPKSAIRNHKSKIIRPSRRPLFETLESRSLLAVVAYWSANNTAVDSVGGNNGMLYNGASYAAGQVGQAFEFDGIDDRVNIADSNTLKLTHSLTIEGWVRIDAFPSAPMMGEIIFRGDDRGGLDPYQLASAPGGYVRFIIDSEANEREQLQIPAPQGEFIHLAATLDDATGAMSLYENGTLVAQKITQVRPFADLDPALNPGVGIGNGNVAFNFPFCGLIDELKLYDEALTPAQVLAHYNAARGSALPTTSIGDTATIEGQSHFGASLGQLVAQDASGNLTRSTGMTLGPDSSLYVSSGLTDEVLKYNASTGEYSGVFIASGSGGLSQPGVGGLIFRPDGKLYVLSTGNSNILRYDGATGAFLDTFVSSGSGGLTQPKGMAFGSDGNLYVASNDHRVLRYSGATGAFLGDFVTTRSGGLNNPRALTFAPDGNLYVSNAGTNAVLRYNGATGAFLDTFIPSNLGGLAQPAGLLFHNGSLYVASQGNDQMLRFDSATGAFLDAVDAANSGSLDRPIGLLLAPSGNLLVGSYGEIAGYGSVNSALFSVSLSSPRPEPVSISYVTANGTALANGDFAPASGTMTFAPGELTKSITVPILDDTAYEGNESFFVNLSNPVGATIADGQGVGTIIDNDPQPTKFYVVDDGSANKTFEYGAGGTAIENYAVNSGNSAPRGVATTATGTMVWVADANKHVYVYNTSGALLGSWTAGSLPSNASVQGIATNGTDVWIIDDKGNKVYKYVGAASRLSGSQNAASSFSLNSSNGNPMGLATDGASIWVVNNSSTDKVFKYTVSGSLQGSWTISGGGGSPTGLTIDPSGASSSIWIVDSASDRVYEFISAKSRTSGSQSPASYFALAPGNTNPQGIADPPPAASQSAIGNPQSAIPQDAALLAITAELEKLLAPSGKKRN